MHVPSVHALYELIMLQCRITCTCTVYLHVCIYKEYTIIAAICTNKLCWKHLCMKDVLS